MSKALIDAIKKSREVRIESEGKVFIIRRPTDMEALNFHGNGLSAKEIFKNYVVGWDHFTGLDFSPTGDPDPQPFDSELFQVWVEDHPEHWQPIMNGVTEAYRSYITRKAESLKN